MPKSEGHVLFVDCLNLKNVKKNQLTRSDYQLIDQNLGRQIID
jgi:hypothetical protein